MIKCPLAVKLDGCRYILCKKNMKDEKDYTNPCNALEAFCLCQQYCKVEGMINSDDYTECYNKKILAP